jgi:hypothetical protein
MLVLTEGGEIHQLRVRTGVGNISNVLAEVSGSERLKRAGGFENRPLIPITTTKQPQVPGAPPLEDVKLSCVRVIAEAVPKR